VHFPIKNYSALGVLYPDLSKSAAQEQPRSQAKNPTVLAIGFWVNRVGSALLLNVRSALVLTGFPGVQKQDRHTNCAKQKPSAKEVATNRALQFLLASRHRQV
jgi:hypothetical protein